MIAAPPSKRTFRVQHCETQADWDRAVAIRIAVFVDEQKFSMEDELDDKDASSDHFLLIAKHEDGTEEDAGTIRWWPKPNVHPPAGKLGRLAVHKHFRGGGSGKLLVLAMEEHVKQRRGKAGIALKGEKSAKVICHSQTHAQKFYEKSGYVAEGDVFIEDGGPHILLTKVLELKPE
ncbi:hypothetical protein JCM6882_002842 [Rhodosporidiobolus microsporus]